MSYPSVSPVFNEEDSETILKELLGEDSFSLTNYLERDLAALTAPEAIEYDAITQFVPNIIAPLSKATSIQPESEGLNWIAAEQSLLQQQFQTQQFFPNNIVFKPDLDAYNPAIAAVQSQYLTTPLVNDTPTPTTNTKPLKQTKSLVHHHDISDDDDSTPKEEKTLKRKLQTRAASKLYRQRKKALEVQLTERLNQLEEEKRLLLQQQANAERLLQNLREENCRLRQQQEVTSKEVSKTRLELLKKLAQQINEEADEEALKHTLAEISKCCKKCTEIGSCTLKRLISSNSVEQLVNNGFFDDKQRLEILARGRGGLAAIGQKIKEEIKTLTPAQIAIIDTAIQEKTEDFEVFYKERAELVQQITTVFRELKTNKNDMTLMLESVRCLEHLRKSLESEAHMWNEGFHEMVDCLSPLQGAQVLLRIEYQFATVCQLSAFWDALNQSVGSSPFATTPFPTEIL